jgi:light-regulated signal transduction histidine kinase (bacteriophytochrome)/CheY-like chemotaxis protein
MELSTPHPAVDLTNCDREPIHIPGAIQPHGALIACRVPGLSITHVSQNAAALLGISAAELLGQPIGLIFPEQEAAAWQQALLRDVTDTKPVYLFTLPVRGAPAPFDAIAHRIGDLLCVEFEPSGERPISAPELYRLVQQSIARLGQSKSVDELCRICTEQVQQINGFDRVMLYRFDADWNGQVVAEQRRSSLEPFLGLHYPASDIPKQARELYEKNWLRFISDRDYVPSPVISTSDEMTHGPLDMSFCVLRSVSPIHIQYLKNMGVGASMSISLIQDGKLWGLIACHHYCPRFVSYDIRTACELLGQMMSLQLQNAAQAEMSGDRIATARVREQMLNNLDQFDDTARAMIDSLPNLLNMIESDGAALVVGNRVYRIGHTPGEDQVLRLSGWLSQNANGDLFATDNLPALFGSAVLGNVASGVLAVFITTSPVHLIVWFRTEQVRTVNWAGDPAKSVIKGDGEVRLSPRGSFTLWKETVKGRSKPWKSSDLEAAQSLHDGIMRRLLSRTEKLMTAHTDLRLASEEREKLLETERAARGEAERVNRMKDEFVATLSHELRTPLNAILGWSQVLMRTDNVGPDVMEAVEIIERNARSQAQMIEDLLEISRIISGKLRLEMRPTNLPAVISAAIDTVELAAVAKGIQIQQSVDPLHGIETTGDSNRLQQVVWNLLANAVKFTPRGGKVQVVLERVDSHIELRISDNGQGIDPEFLPYVFDRFRQEDASMTRQHGGLGLGLSIVRHLVELHGGNVRAHSTGVGRGATFTVSLPIRAVRVSQVDSQTQVQPKDDGIDQLKMDGIKVLIVDDEPDARHLTRRVLADRHCIITEAVSQANAITILKREKFDVIVADIGMPGGDGISLIREWREFEAKTGLKKTPAIALTAYARAEDRHRVILAGFQAHVPKPVDATELTVLVASLSVGV